MGHWQDVCIGVAQEGNTPEGPEPPENNSIGLTLKKDSLTP